MPATAPAITAIVFDFDGVLADTERLHLAAFQRVFATRGWTLDERAYFDRYLGYDDQGLVRAYARDRAVALAPADVQALVAAKGRQFGEMVAGGDVLFAGARPCIERVARHYTLGIASGALRAEIVDILSGAGLVDAFSTIVAAEDVVACKPSPEPYLTAARRLGFSPAACAAVEDSVPGLDAARAAGMRTIAVATTSPRALLSAADRVIEGLDGISRELVDALGSGSAL